jgi:hypothetical protein
VSENVPPAPGFPKLAFKQRQNLSEFVPFMV